MDEHDLVKALKDLVLTLGRIPSGKEFENSIVNGKNKIAGIGGYTVLLQAAGLPTYDERRNKKKIDASVFNKSIETHLQNYEPPTYTLLPPYPTAAIISDIHWPFSYQPVIDRFTEYVGDMKPEWVILNGDAWDMYSHTRFPRSHNVFTPREERTLARKMNADFWEAIIRISPDSQCRQTLGNHDVRPLKRILEEYPESEDWIQEGLNKDFTFPGVTTLFDPRQEVYLSDEIIVFHGYKSGIGGHRDYTLMSCINGHTHKGGVVFRRVRGKLLFELNSGYAGDPLAKGLTYTPQKIVEWTWGFGALDNDGPRFIPV